MTCRMLKIVLMLCMLTGSAAAVSLGEMRQNWRNVFAAHIRSEAAREGILLTNVQIRVDARRRSVTLAGTIATPDDVRKLHEIIQSAGMTVADERRLLPLQFPSPWPALVCAPADGLNAGTAAAAARAISNYVNVVSSYDTQVRTLPVRDGNFTRTWRTLIGIESTLLNSPRYVVKNRPASALRSAAAAPVSTNTLYQDAAEIMRQYKPAPAHPRR